LNLKPRRLHSSIRYGNSYPTADFPTGPHSSSETLSIPERGTFWVVDLKSDIVTRETVTCVLGLIDDRFPSKICESDYKYEPWSFHSARHLMLRRQDTAPAKRTPRRSGFVRTDAHVIWFALKGHHKSSKR
jgi:hypothetical protein